MPHRRQYFRTTCLLLFGGILISTTAPAGQASNAVRSRRQTNGKEINQPLDEIRRYISAGWDRLTRSLDDCKTFEDVKTDADAILYLPKDLPNPVDEVAMQKRCSVRLNHLPTAIAKIGPKNIEPNQPEGLLYLEHPYVVPGGQFNEMYGWDSYFIIRGLLRENRIALARGMVENFFFEIENYGGVLNANRTYYLTRSQPPYLTSMILAVYQAENKSGHQDKTWLARAYRLAAQDYEQWTGAAHRAGDTGLSHYFDFGQGPVPEILGDPSHYYRGVAQFFLMHEGKRSKRLRYFDEADRAADSVGPIFPVFDCDSTSKPSEQLRCDHSDRMALTDDFYKGDRSMRESGFDVSFRFGPFGADTHRYAPDCLNSLLFKTEKDLEQMATILGRSDDAQRWARKADERKQEIVKYLWDSDRDMFFDYNFATHSRSSYEYATTFYPLWAGLASEEQARAVAKNLARFEQPGGIAMGRVNSQAQWDYPYGWAPVHLLAVEGLRRYGYAPDADRIAYKFLLTVLRNFRRDGTIREKYDVVAKSDETHVGAGYKQNQIGFGWTNGVFLELLSQLPPALLSRLEREAKP